MAPLGKCLIGIVLLVGLCVRRAPAQIDAAQVRQAIERGVAYLEREQDRNGSWAEWQGQTGAVSALCTLALLNAGVDRDDPSAAKALARLRSIRPDRTYAVALHTMALCAARSKRDLALLRDNVRWIEKVQLKTGPQRGGWAYPQGLGDSSNTQFALLALYEAEQVGVPVSDHTWTQALKYWRELQNADGSWGYQRGGGGSGSMTSAGVASMVIASGRLDEPDAQVVGDQVRCCGSQEKSNSIDRALAWLGRNFSVEVNPGSDMFQSSVLYYLYALERAGRLTAQRFVGEHDWYRAGAETLVRRQDQLSGFWRGAARGEDNPLVATSFALLFLSKGRRPVLMAKLRHGPGDDWNHHRHDVDNLTRFVETRWERDLTWQIIDPRAATVDDLAQSPVLFFNGREAPQFTDDEVRNLRRYVDQGGFLFAEACCDGAEFDRGFRALMEKAFPEPEYRLRLLPPDHPVWQAEDRIDPEMVRPLWGLDIGCRTSVIYCPEDLSCFWELARPGREARLPASVRLRVTAANSIGVNVLAYATNRELRYKDEVPSNADSPLAAEDPLERAKMQVARLRHTGGWNVAPNALVTVQRALERELGLSIRVDGNDVNLADKRLLDYHLVFMHGRHDFRLDAAQRSGLRQFVERGGLLIADSICASDAFDRALRREMEAVFPEHALQPISIDNPMFSPALGGFDITKVTRREPQRDTPEAPLKTVLRQVAPELEGIRVGDRYGVIYSRYDLSCSLERHESLECRGYSREDAARIAINLVLYSLHQ